MKTTSKIYSIHTVCSTTCSSLPVSLMKALTLYIIFNQQMLFPGYVFLLPFNIIIPKTIHPYSAMSAC